MSLVPWKGPLKGWTLESSTLNSHQNSWVSIFDSPLKRTNHQFLTIDLYKEWGLYTKLQKFYRVFFSKIIFNSRKKIVSQNRKKKIIWACIIIYFLKNRHCFFFNICILASFLYKFMVKLWIDWHIAPVTKYTLSCSSTLGQSL